MFPILGTQENPAGLYNLPSFATKKDPRNNAGFARIREIGRKAADDWRGIADAERPGLAAWILENSDDVIDEVNALRRYREAHPVDYARRIVVMAMLSAQVHFAENLHCTRRIISGFDNVCTLARIDIDGRGETARLAVQNLLTAPYQGVGNYRRINGYRTKAGNLVDSLPWLCSLTADNVDQEMTLENVRRLSGVGPKIAAFTMALWDARLPVFTLDVWMLRLTAGILGRETRFTTSLTNEAYSLIEGDWLAWCHRTLPGMSPFVIQWTLWNGCFGYHRSHLDIIR